MGESTGLFDIIHCTRAMRRLKPDPVDDRLIAKVLRAGAAAANGGNRQNWKFLVIKDPGIKQRVQAYYQRGFNEVVGPSYARGKPPAGMNQAQYERQMAAVRYLTEHFHEAPVWIVACQQDGGPLPGRGAGASIYPAVQNMLLAIRGLGLGSTLTNRHMIFEKEVDEILGLPAGFRSYAILPIGHPMGKFGPVRRRPLSDYVYLDRWGQAYSGLE